MKTKLTLLALAVSATVATPAALAQSVELYGKLYPYLLSESGSGATATGTPVATMAKAAKGANAIIDQNGMMGGKNSRWGLRGSEDLGGGLKAQFQLEGTAPVDSGDNGGILFSRNTFVGLKGNFGTIHLGNMDTIFKSYGDILGILGFSSGSYMSSSSILRLNATGYKNSTFHVRAPNSVQYESPEMGGFQVGVQYAPGDPGTLLEAKTATRNPYLVSMGVQFDHGPWYVSLTHEIHNDYFGGSGGLATGLTNLTDLAVNSNDTATQFSTVYTLAKGHKLEFNVIRKNYDENATVTGRFNNYNNLAYLLAMENKWNNQWSTAVHYVSASAGSCSRIAAACVTDGLDGHKVTLAAMYNLSKRTGLFASVGKLTNGTSAQYSNAEFSNKPNTGEAITDVAFGITHSF